MPTIADDVFVSAPGTYTVTVIGGAANSLTVDDPGATISVTRFALQIGKTLTLEAGRLDLTLSGMISGGVLSMPGGVFLWDGGYLDGVAFNGTLDLSPDNSSLFVTAKGLTLHGADGVSPGLINITGFSTSLDFEGTQTFDNATINLGDATGHNTLGENDQGSAGNSVVTFGPHITINHAAGSAYVTIQSSGVAGDGIISEGAINAAVSGGDLAIQVNTFINEGAITVSNGDTVTSSMADFINAANSTILVESGSTMSINTAQGANLGLLETEGGEIDIEGTFSLPSAGRVINNGGVINIGLINASATLENAGNTLAVGPGSTGGPLTLNYYGTISGGVIADAGGGLADGGTLDGVTYQGTLTVTTGQSATISANGLISQGVGGVGDGVIEVGALAGLTFVDTQMFNNATIDITTRGDVGQHDHSGASAGGVLTLGPNLTVNDTGAGVVLESGVNAGDAIINAGTINAAFAGGDFTVECLTFTNTGTITVSNGDVFSVSATPDFTNLAGTTLNGGRFEVEASSKIELVNSATIVTDNAVLILNGAGSSIQSGGGGAPLQIETTLATIASAGVLEILGGRGWSSSHTVTNDGLLELGGGTFAAAGLVNAAGATLTGFGSITSSLIDSGVVSLAGVITASGQTKISIGASTAGTGTFALTNATVSGLTVGGTVMLGDLGVVDQTGLITIGDKSGSTANLMIAAGDVWKVDGNYAIARGLSKASAITIAGTLIKDAGTRTSRIGLAVADTGLVEVSAGLLDLSQAVTGTGMLKIDAGATLEFDLTAAKTLTATFNGGGATLSLKKAAKFAATIAGFAAGDTIDLLNTAATSVSLNGSDQLVVLNGTKTVATLQLSGSYAGDTFSLGSDGHGGSAITVATTARVSPFIQAAASLGAGANDAVGMSLGPHNTVVTASPVFTTGPDRLRTSPNLHAYS